MDYIKNTISKLLLRLCLRIHYELYFIIDKMVVRVHKGKHPKKNFLKYEEWFLKNISNDSTVVDIGSNNGFLAYLLSKKADQVYGIELSESHVEMANKDKPNNCTFFLADATTFNFSQFKKVDFITLSNVLEHIKDRVTFIKKIIEANNSNTMFLIRVPTLERDWIPPYLKSLGLPYFLDPTHFIEHTESEIRTELNDAGLKINSLETKYGEYYLVCSVK